MKLHWLGILALTIGCTQQSDPSPTPAPDNKMMMPTTPGGPTRPPGPIDPQLALLCGPSQPINLNTLAPCQCGQNSSAKTSGHCVSKQMVPARAQQELANCPNDPSASCVPDRFASVGGIYTPPSCTAFDGKPGVCLNSCVVQVGTFADLLKTGKANTSTCAPDELCAPCEIPGKSGPGPCDIGKGCPLSRK
jgi:hypothetical protein